MKKTNHFDLYKKNHKLCSEATFMQDNETNYEYS